MVDFNNEITIGTPALEVEKITILQRRYDTIEAFEHYKKKFFSGGGSDLSIIKARLLSLFIEIQACLLRRDPANCEKIKNLCTNNKISEKEILETIFLINQELDNLNLTRIDNNQIYNKRRVEEENEIKGF